MHIIVNSDVIYSNRLISTGLPRHLATFCQEAAAEGCRLVIPRTALLEYERHQNELADQAILKTDNAIKLLKELGAEIPDLQPKQLVKKGDILKELEGTGIPVQVEDATIDDF